MRLSRVEFIAMNNPPRRWMQKHVEFARFRRYLARRCFDPRGKDVLDAGCGSGYSTRLIWEGLRPARLTAFDLMPEQIALARRRGVPAEFFVGDVTATGLPDQSFDLVFVFGILHHVPNWRQALVELRRVLRPGGALLVEELSAAAIHPFMLLGFRHPREALFTWPQFEAGLRAAGFAVWEQGNVIPLFGGARAYLCARPLPPPGETD